MKEPTFKERGRGNPHLPFSQLDQHALSRISAGHIRPRRRVVISPEFDLDFAQRYARLLLTERCA